MYILLITSLVETELSVSLEAFFRWSSKEVSSKNSNTVLDSDKLLCSHNVTEWTFLFFHHSIYQSCLVDVDA